MNKREALKIVTQMLDCQKQGSSKDALASLLVASVNVHHVPKGTKFKTRLVPSRDVQFEGNNGGSYIRVQDAYDDRGNTIEGMIELEVGETCVRTINQQVSVCGLAAVLTHCKYLGFQTVIDTYLAIPGGQPALRIDEDTAVRLREDLKAASPATVLSVGR